MLSEVRPNAVRLGEALGGKDVGKGKGVGGREGVVVGVGEYVKRGVGG